MGALPLSHSSSGPGPAVIHIGRLLEVRIATGVSGHAVGGFAIPRRIADTERRTMRPVCIASPRGA